MDLEFQEIKLETAGDGELALMFQEAQSRIAQDMVDPVKVHDGKREIIMRMIVEPSEDEDSKAFTLSIDCQTKLAKRKAKHSFGQMDEKGTLMEPKSEQAAFDFDAVVAMEGGG